jgi:ribonuclease BN (tRNA processing enzyme)
MKLITLGTASGFPVKGKGCEANLLEVNGSVYFFDAGKNISEAIVNLDYEYTDVKAVFITHPHRDHIATLGELVDLSCWRYKDMAFKIFVPSIECVNLVTYLCNDFAGGEKIDKNRVTFTVYTAGVIYQDENIKVTAFPNTHMHDSHSFLVEAEGKRLFITGDLDKDMASLSEEATKKENDFLLVECAHFSEEVVLKVFPTLNAKRVVITHVGRQVPITKLAQWIEEGKLKMELADDYQEFII